MLSKDVTKVSFQENEQRASLSIEVKVTRLTKRTGPFYFLLVLKESLLWQEITMQTEFDHIVHQVWMRLVTYFKHILLVN